MQEEAKSKGLPWTIAKGFDTFLPISEPIPAAAVNPHPDRLHLWLAVNGAMKQSDSTGLMIYNIPRQLSAISEVMTLEPGDIVLTGTPKGVGAVESGDVLTAGIRRPDGTEFAEGRIEVTVEDRPGSYAFRET